MEQESGSRMHRELINHIMTHSTPANGGCRLWTRGKDSNGYASLSVNGVHERGHRLVYAATHGPIPKGMEVRHTCDNPACVAIEHLLLGTHADNMRDMRERKRHRWGERPRGTAVNTNKLTEADVLAIRTDSRGCWRLARAYGVSPSTIKAIRTRRIWRWL